MFCSSFLIIVWHCCMLSLPPFATATEFTKLWYLFAVGKSEIKYINTTRWKSQKNERHQAFGWMVNERVSPLHYPLILCGEQQKNTPSHDAFFFSFVYWSLRCSCVSYILSNFFFFLVGAFCRCVEYFVLHFFASCFTEIQSGIYCITFVRLNSPSARCVYYGFSS